MCIKFNVHFIHRAPRNPNIHKCLVCDNFHSLRYCRIFLKKSAMDRRRVARNYGYCLNCLARSHRSQNCTSRDSCQRCGNDHHTLLHMSIQQRMRSQSAGPRAEVQNGRRQQQRKQNQTQRLGLEERRPRTTKNENANSTREPKSLRRREQQPTRRRQNQHRVQEDRRQYVLSGNADYTRTPNPRRCVRVALRALECLQQSL